MTLEMKDMQMENNAEQTGIVSRILKDVNKDDIRDSEYFHGGEHRKIAGNWSE